MKLYEVKLSFDELKLIDGKVSDEAQKVINLAKKESSYGFSFPIMNEILRKAEENGTLTWTYKDIRSCSYCDDKPHDYYVYPRNTKYNRKGAKNYDKPKYYRGIKFHEGFVTIQGYGDMCSDCCEKHNVINQLIDYILDNDLKIQIQKNGYRDSKYLKDEILICYKCEYEMAESEMTKSPTVMGNGYYASGCPKCGAEKQLFGNSHKSTNKFKHRISPLYSNEVQKLKQLVKIHNENNDKENQVSLGQLKKNENVIVIQETEFNNGYRDVVRFDITKKIYHIGYFWKKKASNFVDILNQNGYTETENQYFYML